MTPMERVRLFADTKCANEGCANRRTEGDHLGMCLDCNPFGDSLVMNNDPAYRSWLFRAEY